MPDQPLPSTVTQRTTLPSVSTRAPDPSGRTLRRTWALYAARTLAGSISAADHPAPRGRKTHGARRRLPARWARPHGDLDVAEVDLGGPAFDVDHADVRPVGGDDPPAAGIEGTVVIGALPLFIPPPDGRDVAAHGGLVQLEAE